MVTRKMLLAVATVATVGLVGAGVVATASAQAGPGGREGWHHGAGSLLDGVTLTDDQKTALHTMLQGGFASTKALRQQMRAVREQIETTLLSSGPVTAATVAPLVQQQEALMQQLDAQRIAQAIAIRGMLTPTQLAQASTAHAQLVALHQQETNLRDGEASSPPQ